jgi:MFS family permease
MSSALTFRVVVAAFVAAMGGSLFGYDVGVIGGVESMPSFLREFFPSVYEKKMSYVDGESPYCVFDDALLSFFTSSVFVAGLISALVASSVTRAFGRKASIAIGGSLFVVGGAVNASAQNLAMLVAGRISIGLGVGELSEPLAFSSRENANSSTSRARSRIAGFVNSSVPLYISEIAPKNFRGAMNSTFQLAATAGILVAQLVNYGVGDLDFGWRISLGLICAPALFVVLGCVFLPESPNSLAERERLEECRIVLEKIRGSSDVWDELDDIAFAASEARNVSQLDSWKRLFSGKRHAHSLAIGVAVPAFQQFTGVNAIMFFAPILFSSLGSGHETALLNAVVIGAVNLLSTLAAVFLVDRAGRRPLFFVGGVQMLLSHVALAFAIGFGFSGGSSSTVSTGAAAATLVFVCTFVSGFAVSWGPLAWLVPSEVQSLETRTAGTSLTASVNFLFTFLIGQTFLPMLCSMEFGVFVFFGAFVAAMTAFVFFFVPETKGVPIENVDVEFSKHWFWKRFLAGSVETPTIVFETGP